MFELVKASEEDVSLILEIQKLCFLEYLKKYNDGDVNPANETYDHLKMYIEIENNSIYIIRFEGENIGIIKVKQIDEKTCKLNDFGIIPKFRDKHIGRDVFLEIKKIYNMPNRWMLSTILEESRNIHFYEKLGFIRDYEGTCKTINEKMTIVPYKLIEDN